MTVGGAQGARPARAVEPGEARTLGRWLLLGAGAGAAAGVVFGGVAGRVVMLILRERSPGADGLTSDAGFEIGRITVQSLNLVLFGLVAGVLFGLVYLLVRVAFPRVARVPVATLLGGCVGGAAFIEPDGIDLLVLDPLWFAVASFIALPALAGLATALIVERVARREPWSTAPPVRRLPGLALPARLVVMALVLAVVVSQAIVLVNEVARVL